MPPTYCPCPRPILKRRTPSPEPAKAPLECAPRDESLLDIDPSAFTALVHFPPPTDLARTFPALSASIYDRSPIVVTPNKCSLPERGCPGKTYLPGDELSERHGAALAFASRHRSGKKSRDQSPAGRHPHPRAVRVHLPQDDEDEDDELTPKATPAAHCHPLPPLIPDVSSSSDSEESDAFVCPPMDSTSIVYAPLYTTSLASTSTANPRNPGLSIPIPSPDLSASFTAMYLSPKSSPTSPMSFRSRIASYASRSPSPARSLSPARSHSPCRDSTSPRRRRSKSKHVRACPTGSASSSNPCELDAVRCPSERNSFDSCTLNAFDDGCLGGF